MEIRYDKEALKYLRKLQKNQRDMILNAIDGLTETPPKGDIKIMQGYDGRYRLRVGKYRVIYRYETDIREEVGETIKKIDILVVMLVGSRGDIYK